MHEWWNDETHIQSLSPFWEEWVQDNHSQKSLWEQEFHLLHQEQVLVDRFQNVDHRPWGSQYDQFYTLPKLIPSDTICCRQSKHNDLIHSLGEKHFLLQGQNPNVSLRPDLKAAAFSALHLTVCTNSHAQGTVCSSWDSMAELDSNSSRWQRLREGYKA